MADFQSKGYTSGPERAFYGVRPNTHLSGYLPHRNTLGNQPLSHINIPSQRLVNFGMLGQADYLEVLRSVINRVSVDVVDVFMGVQFSADGFTRHRSMLLDLFPVDRVDSVSSGINATDVLVSPVALSRAEAVSTPKHAGIASYVGVTAGALLCDHLDTDFDVTSAGEQYLFTGVDPIRDGDKVHVKMGAPMRGGDAPMQEDGLFGSTVDQLDLF